MLFRSPAAAMDGPTGDATSSVIFMYHRFGEDQYPSTNIKLDQFKAHIKERSEERRVGKSVDLGGRSIIKKKNNKEEKKKKKNRNETTRCDRRYKKD